MEGFKITVELWTWDENEESVRARLDETFPVSARPSERMFHYVIKEIEQTTHRPRSA
jgi:hypothetical protein